VTPSFSPRQLDLELALLLGDLHTKLYSVLGAERAALAFRFPLGRQEPWEFPPEEIPVDEFPIREDAHLLAAYVTEQRGYRVAGIDINNLKLLTYWITEELEDFWAGAHSTWPEFAASGITPDGNGDELDLAVGVHYRGIIKSLVAHGSARLKIDNGQPLTLTELALLAGHNERSVMSAASRGEFPSIAGEKRRLVNADDALDWLLPRGYKPTRWESESPRGEALSEGLPTVEAVFVPVARDGSMFEPSCRTSGGYTVGEKLNEQKFQDFYEALDALTQMPTPKWRRPNLSGNRGIVSGVEWHRVSKATMDSGIEKVLRASRGKSHEKDG
jgi:hypothetical protein